MYVSPIETITNEIRHQMVEEHERQILTAVQAYGINVDKEELVKALKYDRDQYQKGYADAKAEIIRCKDCTHFHEDVFSQKIGPDDIPLILAHEMCDFWGEGCKTSENAFCSFAERRTDG